MAAALALGMAGCVSDSKFKADTLHHESAGPLTTYARGSLAHMETWATPQLMPDLAFQDGDGKTVHLQDFKGRVVILNTWATWLAPARFEVPTLANLQRRYGAEGLVVIALSADISDRSNDAKAFIERNPPLPFYFDPDFISKTQGLSIMALPTTLIIDKQGREVARLVGESIWDTPEVAALVEHLLAE